MLKKLINDLATTTISKALENTDRRGIGLVIFDARYITFFRVPVKRILQLFHNDFSKYLNHDTFSIQGNKFIILKQTFIFLQNQCKYFDLWDFPVVIYALIINTD